jgi:hypothetical protein
VVTSAVAVFIPTVKTCAHIIGAHDTSPHRRLPASGKICGLRAHGPMQSPANTHDFALKFFCAQAL